MMCKLIKIIKQYFKMHGHEIERLFDMVLECKTHKFIMFDRKLPNTPTMSNI